METMLLFLLDKRSSDGTPVANFKVDDIEARWPHFMPPFSRRQQPVYYRWAECQLLSGAMWCTVFLQEHCYNLHKTVLCRRRQWMPSYHQSELEMQNTRRLILEESCWVSTMRQTSCHSHGIRIAPHSSIVCQDENELAKELQILANKAREMCSLIGCVLVQTSYVIALPFTSW